MSTPKPSRQPSRISLGRYPERGHYDFETIAAILDDGLVCYVGTASENQPIVIPAIYGRIDRRLYVHGSSVARWLKDSQSPSRVCVTVSLLDALVLARSAYQHTLNYRSVVVIAEAQAVVERDEKIEALRAIVEHVCPGRWNDVRHPTDAELRATLVLRVPIAEASAKVRTGPPSDFESDLARTTWAGTIPLHSLRGTPVDDPALAEGIGVPSYCREQRRCKTFIS